MAEKRMFAKTIIDSDAFLDMPLSAQALYFHLSMRADDDGFINNCKKIQRMINASDDDCKILAAKKFIIPFESGVIVIKHWRIHNCIQSDRYKPTVYQKEMATLKVKENNTYKLIEPALYTGCIQTGNRMETDCIQIGNKMETQVRLDKVRLDKISLDKNRLNKNKEKPSNTISEQKTVKGEIDKYTTDIDLRQSLFDFVEMRKKIRKPLTIRGMLLNLSKLDKLATNTQDKIAIVNQSIERSWQGLFELDRVSLTGKAKAIDNVNELMEEYRKEEEDEQRGNP